MIDFLPQKEIQNVERDHCHQKLPKALQMKIIQAL